jgi:hypothetical protein
MVNIVDVNQQRRRPIKEVERILRDYTPNPLSLEW